MKSVRNRLLSLLLIAAMLLPLVGCGSAPQAEEIWGDGAARFGEGKEEKDYSLAASGKLLDEMIEKYSGGYQPPTGREMTDDEFDDAREQTGGGAAPGDDTPTPATPAPDTVYGQVNSRVELERLMLSAYQQTSTYLSFSTGGGYDPDLGLELEPVYRDLQREDPINASCVESWTWGVNAGTYIISINYSIPAQELADLKAQTLGLVQKAVSGIDSRGKSEYELVCAVNDYLCDTVYYPPQEPYEPVTHTAYGALADGCAVCEGYACAAKLLLNALGVSADIEVGTCIDGGGHAWNLVKVDNAWYQVDVTWNDCSNARGEYLLVTDDFMRQSRTWIYSDYPSTPSVPYTP